MLGTHGTDSEAPTAVNEGAGGALQRIFGGVVQLLRLGSLATNFSISQTGMRIIDIA